MKLHYQKAIHAVRALQNGRPYHFDFLFSITSAMLAAAHATKSLRALVTYDPQVEKYADAVGLKKYVEDGVIPSARHGKGNNSPLATVSTHLDVDFANEVLCRTIKSNLGNFDPAATTDICNVLGELHDNIASHARGHGFSAAQVYSGNICNFAVVDSGRGLLASARHAAPNLQTDAKALDWCLQKGNTGSVVIDSWAQRIYDDDQPSPYPEGVPTRMSENHHMGEGLWQLGNLVTKMKGQLWLCTGDASMVFDAHGPRVQATGMRWKGFAVEGTFEIPDRTVRSDEAELAELGRLLGV